MNSPLTYPFTPGLSQRIAASTNSQLPGLSNGSQALQVLSLNLPNSLQGHPAASQSLLNPNLNSPALNPAPLSFATPQLGALTSNAVGPSSPFTPPPTDTGAGAPSGPGAPRITVPSAVHPTLGPAVAPQANTQGLSDMMTALLGASAKY